METVVLLPRSKAVRAEWTSVSDSASSADVDIVDETIDRPPNDPMMGTRNEGGENPPLEEENDDHLDRLTSVEDKDIRIFDECTRAGDALFLPTG